MNVLVIPEDFRKDQYILRPLIRAALAAAGRPNANVRVLTDPLLGGVSQAMNLRVLQDEVLPRYRMFDLFLLLVDRDGDPNRRAALLNIETTLNFFLGATKCFLAEAAIEELEVWVLAAATLPSEWSWAEIRSEIHPKEIYFDALVAGMGLENEPGGGRETLGRTSAGMLRRLRQLCPEVNLLCERISAFCSEGRTIQGPYRI